MGVCVTDNAAALKEFARPGSVVCDSLPSYRAALDREGVASQVDRSLTGSIEDIAEGFATYIAAGVTDLRVGIWSRTNDERTATQEALASFLHGL